jgi:hypothetical protein
MKSAWCLVLVGIQTCVNKVGLYKGITQAELTTMGQGPHRLLCKEQQISPPRFVCQRLSVCPVHHTETGYHRRGHQVANFDEVI